SDRARRAAPATARSASRRCCAGSPRAARPRPASCAGAAVGAPGRRGSPGSSPAAARATPRSPYPSSWRNVPRLSCAAGEAAAPLTVRRDLVRVELAGRASRAVRHRVRRLVVVGGEPPALGWVEPQAPALLAHDQQFVEGDLVRVHDCLFDKNAG